MPNPLNDLNNPLILDAENRRREARGESPLPSPKTQRPFRFAEDDEDEDEDDAELGDFDESKVKRDKGKFAPKSGGGESEGKVEGKRGASRGKKDQTDYEERIDIEQGFNVKHGVAFGKAKPGEVMSQLKQAGWKPSGPTEQSRGEMTTVMKHPKHGEIEVTRTIPKTREDRERKLGFAIELKK